MKKSPNSTDQFEAIAAATTAPANSHYVLRLFIIGTTSQSMRAVSNIRKICEENLEGRYKLDIVDISQHPALAKGEQIVAAPTLIKQLPLPLRRFIGDMSQTERILVGLDLGKRLATSPTAIKA